MSATHYRPEIDGLRALAVMAVVLFHVGWGMPGGYIGVDVFFVISGYLITGILLRSFASDSFSLAEFWERRVRRIFPALLVTIAVTLCAGYLLLLPDELADLGESTVYQSLLIANVYFWRDTGYFAGPAEFKPLLHTWSLAVEEQFYLAFPLALYLLRRRTRGQLFSLFAIVALLSFLASVYATRFHAAAAFYLLPTRAWELLAGCLLAIAPWRSRLTSRTASGCAAAGLAAVLIPCAVYDATTPFPGLAAMPPVLGTVAVILATTHHDSWVRRGLSLRPIVFVGRISYSLYLWHWPILVFARTTRGELGWSGSAAVITAAFVMAIGSWRFVETPWRQSHVSRRPLFAWAASLSGGLLAVGLLWQTQGGFPGRLQPELQPLYEDVTWSGKEWALPRSGARDLQLRDLPTLGVVVDEEDSRLDFVLWGDSHGMVLTRLVDALAREQGLAGKAILQDGSPCLPRIVRHGSQGNPPSVQARDKCRISECLDRARPRHVLLAARWSLYTDGLASLEGGGPVLLSADPGAPPTDDPTTLLAEQLHELHQFCRDRSITLWVLKQVPETAERAPARDWLLYHWGRRPAPVPRPLTERDHRERQANSERLFAHQDASLRLLDPAPQLFADGGEALVFQDGRSLYRDNDHLSISGAAHIRPTLQQFLKQVVATRDD